MRSIVARMAALVCAGALALGLVACGGGGNAASSLDAYPASDMGGYSCAQNYNATYQFVDMTVADIAAEMEKGSTFVVLASFSTCPWCNAIVNHLNDVAIDRDIKIGYLDTRRDPSWESNLDIDDYDKLIELFGSAIPDDDSGQPHLYVPHVFFVKDGKLVHDHPGTVSSQKDSSDPLTEEQIEEYHTIINGYLDDIL